MAGHRRGAYREPLRMTGPPVGVARLPFYYGWVNLAVAALAMVGTLPGRTQGLGLVTEPLLADLGLDRIAYATIKAFWLFALSSSVFGLVYSGISLFNQSILEQRGFDASVYYAVLSISTILGLAANFGGGWLAQRWPIQRLMGLGMAVLGCALCILP